MLKLSRRYIIPTVLLLLVFSLGVFVYFRQREKRLLTQLPAHCANDLYDEGEEGLDCGWSCSNKCKFVKKCERLTRNETWSGNVYAECVVEVPEGVTLTIKPGTIVKFKYDRDYKTFNKAGLTATGGTIKVVGAKDQMIWFTSAAPDPINGDWWGITVENSTSSELKYVVVEFGEVGIEQFDSAVTISNSIIRWSNSEGLYAERSKPIFTKNTLYANGYHDIALEQYNQNVQILNNVFAGGNYGIHHEKTSSHIEGNYFQNYKYEAITAGMESEVTIKGNRFKNKKLFSKISIDANCTATIKGNDYKGDKVPIPEFDYQDRKNFELAYVPGDEDDKFPYIYAAEDATRRVIKKIGKDLHFGWALAWAKSYLWRFSIGSGEVGKSLDFIRVDPKTDKHKKYGNDWIMNPRGLAWDGEFFWVNDFSLLKIFKFKVGNGYIKIYDSFDIPEKEKGGTMGLTTDGKSLFLLSRAGEKLYRISKTGDLLGEIQLENSVGNVIVWTGEYFWAPYGCRKGICKFTKEGKLVGEIYPPAKDTWALAWDGKYLWSIQRTCEMWHDPRIYKIEILDDSLEEEEQ